MNARRVYTPYGMRKYYFEMATEFGMPSKKNLRVPASVLNQGRALRRESKLGKNSKLTTKLTLDDLRSQQINRDQLIAEINAIKEIIDAFNALKSHAPTESSDSYLDFIDKHNKFVGGINHHLRGMARFAKNYNQDLLTNINELMQDEIKLAQKPKHLELHAAVLAGDVEAVKLILAKPDIDVNAVDANKNTALHLAAEIGSVDILKLLIFTPNINIDAVNDDGDKPISIAVQKENQNRRALRETSGGREARESAKPDSSHAKIITLLNPADRRKTTQLASDLSDTIDESSNITAPPYPVRLKILSKLTTLFANTGMAGMENTAKYAFNQNYSQYNADKRLLNNTASINPIERSKLFNPLNLLGTALTFINFGIKSFVDKVYNKATSRGPKEIYSGVPAIIIKGILTAPTTIAEVIISGAAEAINFGIESAAKAFSKRKTQTSETTQEATPLVQLSKSSTPKIDNHLTANPTPSNKKTSKSKISRSWASKMGKFSTPANTQQDEISMEPIQDQRPTEKKPR